MPDNSSPNHEVNLAKVVPIKNLMVQIRNVDRELKKFSRSTTIWNEPDQVEGLAIQINRMILLNAATIVHTPEKDPDAKTGQTAKAWRESADETLVATLALTAATKAKKAADFKKAYKVMDKACVKCHEIYRVDAE